MVSYRVLKPYVDGWSFEHRDAGELLVTEDKLQGAARDYTDALIANGFIEKISTDMRWRQKLGGKYWSVGMNPEWQSEVNPDHIQVCDNTEDNEAWDNDLYEGLNYFKSEETAKKVKLALDIFFKWLHYPSNDLDERKPELLLNFQVAQRQARKAVLRDNKSK